MACEIYLGKHSGILILKSTLTHQNRYQPLHSSEYLKNIHPAGRGKFNVQVQTAITSVQEEGKGVGEGTKSLHLFL